MKTLYSYQAKDIKLRDAIANCGEELENAIALLYLPTKCNILKLNNGQFVDAYGTIFKDLNKVFESRIFNSTHELRWLNRKDGFGQGVLLSETSSTKLDSFEQQVIEYQESISQKYLLWGEIIPWDKVVSKHQNFQQGWQRLTEARIDKIDIPFSGDLDENKRIYLQTCEYIAERDYGNMVVIEERLVKLER